MVPERETGTCRSCLHLQMYKAPPAITPGLHIVMELTQFNFHSKEIFQYLFLAFRFVEDPLEWEFFWGSMQTGVHTYTFHILFWYMNALHLAQLFVIWDPAWLRGLMLLTTPRLLGLDNWWTSLMNRDFSPICFTCATFARSSSPLNTEKLCCSKILGFLDLFQNLLLMTFSICLVHKWCWRSLRHAIRF